MELTTSNIRRKLRRLPTDADKWRVELTKYSPALIAKVATLSADEVLSRETPTLASWYKQFGEGAPVEYLQAWLEYITRVMRVEIEPIQLVCVARAMYGNCYHWRVSELLVFASQFIGGRWGHFYGSRFDASVITEAMSKFYASIVRPRQAEQERLDAQAERENWAKEAITPEEFCKSHGYPACKDVLEIIDFLQKHEDRGC